MTEESKISSGKPETEEKNKPEVSDIFRCELCRLHAKYNYYGTRPLERHNEPGSQQPAGQSRKEDLTLLEKCFVCDDPFVESKQRNFLILGSRCSQCQAMVCVSSRCSLFYYTKRFCMKCAKLNIDEFPAEIKAELIKIQQ